MAQDTASENAKAKTTLKVKKADYGNSPEKAIEMTNMIKQGVVKLIKEKIYTNP